MSDFWLYDEVVNGKYETQGWVMINWSYAKMQFNHKDHGGRTQSYTKKSLRVYSVCTFLCIFSVVKNCFTQLQ